MNAEQNQIGWKFWGVWITLTIVGGFIGNYISDAIGWGRQDISGDVGTLLFMLDNGVLALVVCAAQWILLRNHFSNEWFSDRSAHSYNTYLV